LLFLIFCGIISVSIADEKQESMQAEVFSEPVSKPDFPDNTISLDLRDIDIGEAFNT